MLREPVITKDGSHTIVVPGMNVFYHSLYGAIQESKHVYLEAGLRYISDAFKTSELYIFEMGFGTGLNALLTLIEGEKSQQKIHYTTVELFPLKPREIVGLNYCLLLNRPDLQLLFEQLHQSEWEEEINIGSHFVLQKKQADFIDFSIDRQFHLIYYDAFAPLAQPELWTQAIFEKLFAMLIPGGVLVTYCSKGSVRRAMQAAGFHVNKIPGPPGKREMTRALRANFTAFAL